MAGLAGDYGETCVEFLRVFDVNDHDPARTLPELKGFLAFLREMFVKCRVFDDMTYTDEAGADVGSRKTLARIAFEEVQDEHTVTYGSKTRTLWKNGGGVAFVRECKAILASLGRVVTDLTDRMAVEIGGKIETAFVAFDLDSWDRAINRARGTPIDASMLDARLTLTDLGKAAVQLCKAFCSLDDPHQEDVATSWTRMVDEALQERARMRVGPRRTTAEYV